MNRPGALLISTANGGRSAPAGREVADFRSSVVRQALVWLVALKLVGIVLLFDVQGLQAFLVPKSLFSRAIEWLLVGLLVVALVRYGTAIVPRSRLHLAVALWVGVNALAALFAEQPYIALFGHHESYLGLTFVVDMAVLYLAVAVAFRTRDDWLALAAALAAATALVLLYVAAQYLGADPIPWDDDPRERPFATFGHADYLGHFLSVGFGATLGLAVAPAVRIAPRALAVVFAAAIVGAAGVVATRGTLLGFGAALAAVPFIAGASRRHALRAAGVSAVLVAIAVAALAAASAGSPLGERLIGGGAAPTQDRLFLYQSALAAFAEKPILGHGPDGFAVAYPRHRVAEGTRLLGPGRPQVSAHSWVLQTAATTGALGLAALGLLLVSGTWALARGLRRNAAVASPMLLAWLAYWAHGLVAVGTIGVDWVPWVALGAAAAITAREPAPIPVVRAAPGLAAAAAGLMIFSILGAGSGGIAARANEHAGAARSAFTSGSATEASTAASGAVALDSGRAEHWNMLGLARDLGGDARGASEAYAEATRRAPHLATYWRNLARSLSARALAGDQTAGGAGAAIAAARRGVEVDPNDPFARQVLAETSTQFGECDEAVPHAFRAFALYRSGPGISKALADAASCARDPHEARRVLQSALAVSDNENVHLGLARIALALGDMESARRHALRALQINAGIAEARSILDRAGR